MTSHKNSMWLFCFLFCLVLLKTAPSVLAESASAGADYEAYLENELEANLRAASARKEESITSGPMSKDLYKSVRQEPLPEDTTVQKAIPLMLEYSFVGGLKRMYNNTLNRGRSNPGVSRTMMRRKFHKLVTLKTQELMLTFVGGKIEEFGEKNVISYPLCPQRPSLKMDDVMELVRKTLQFKRKFQPAVPPCKDIPGVERPEKCGLYDSHRCCRRPQAEFLGRYYDTAVAAMALGATVDEAFVPLIHARSLALILQRCEDNAMGKKSLQTKRRGYHHAHWSSKLHYKVKFWAKRWNSENDPVRKEWLLPLSTVAIPQQYEVLYEFYNTMLIERMKSRRRKGRGIPKAKQMIRLRGLLYYKKLLVQVAALDFALNPIHMLPTAADFEKVKISFDSSVRLAEGLQESGEHDGVSSMDFLPHTNTSRIKAQDGKIYQRRTHSWVNNLNQDKCNRNLEKNPYYPQEYRTIFWDKYETCCATECFFLSVYGRSFSEGGANCCAGCNRYSCEANSAGVAKTLASLAAIESSGKIDTAPEILSMFV